MGKKKYTNEQIEKFLQAQKDWEKFKLSMDNLMNVVGGTSEFEDVPRVEEHEYDNTEASINTNPKLM